MSRTKSCCHEEASPAALSKFGILLKNMLCETEAHASTTCVFRVGAGMHVPILPPSIRRKLPLQSSPPGKSTEHQRPSATRVREEGQQPCCTLASCWLRWSGRCHVCQNWGHLDMVEKITFLKDAPFGPTQTSFSNNVIFSTTSKSPQISYA
jgi:hypothetical protein